MTNNKCFDRISLLWHIKGIDYFEKVVNLRLRCIAWNKVSKKINSTISINKWIELSFFSLILIKMQFINYISNEINKFKLNCLLISTKKKHQFQSFEDFEGKKWIPSSTRLREKKRVKNKIGINTLIEIIWSLLFSMELALFDWKLITDPTIYIYQLRR